MTRQLLTRVGGLAVLAIFAGGAECVPEPDKSPRDRLIDSYVDYYNRCYNVGSDFLLEVEPRYQELFGIGDIGKLFGDQYDALVENPNVSLDTAKQDACITWLESAPACMDNGFDGDCEEMFVGQLAAGSTCAQDMECVEGLFCQGLTDTACGSCTAFAGQDESCADKDCVEELTCDLSTELCVAFAALGEECTDRECADGLECDWSASTSVCVTESDDPEFRAGDACEANGERCGSWPITGLACLDEDGDQTGVCTQVAIANEGQPCEYTTRGEMLIACRNGVLTTHYCDADIMNQEYTGTCRARPSTGEACTATFNYCNGLEAYCDDSTLQCTALTPEGGSCDPLGQDTCGIFSYCNEDSVCDPMGIEMTQPPVCE